MTEPIVEAARLLTRHAGIRTRLREAIADNLAGQPRAASYDDDRTSPQSWCWKHERPVSQCHRADLFCDGETVTSSDPTGEAAVNPDRARSDETELARLEKQIVDACYKIANLDDRYLPARLPTGANRAKLASGGDPGCEFCESHSKTWSPPCTKDPTTVAGNLPRPVFVCRAHYAYIRTVGRAPTAAETQGYTRTGRWPRQKAA